MAAALPRRSADMPLLWVLPALCLVLLFTLYPVALTLWPKKPPSGRNGNTNQQETSDTAIREASDRGSAT